MLNRARCVMAAVAGAALAAPSPAYLYWAAPQLKGPPVRGDEPGLVVPLPDATPAEMKANLVLAMRAGLNVAALQCQFSPGLMTVGNYNAVIRQHDAEIDDVMLTLQRYFQRTTVKAPPVKAVKGKKAPAKAKPVAVGPKAMVLYDQYVTRTYNSFSTLHGQLSFCDTAAAIGREALATPSGHLVDLAIERMQEFRNSLLPIGDAQLGTTPQPFEIGALPDLNCYNKKGKIIRCKD